MNTLKGYRSIAVYLLILAAGLTGHHLAPELVGRYLDEVFSAIAAVSVFMRIITTGPVGKLVPELAIVAKLQARASALIAVLPTVEIITPPSIDTGSTSPDPSAPAQTSAGQGDVVAMLPIYAAKLAEAVNETLSEPEKVK